MESLTATQFPTNTTHPVGMWLRKITPLLSSIILGRAAEECLTDLHRIDAGTEMSLLALPQWQWQVADPAIVGRRAGAGNKDGIRRLPVRASWQPGALAIITRTPVDHPMNVAVSDDTPLSWTLCGPGVLTSGVMVVTMTDTPESALNLMPGDSSKRIPGLQGAPSADEVIEFPVSFAVAPSTRHDVESALEELIMRGKTAWWDVLTELESNLAYALGRAQTALAHEISLTLGIECPRLLDDTGLFSVQTELTYGNETKPSRLNALIEHSLQPRRFAKADPERVILTTIRREARDGIKRKIGDPHIGSKIRRHIAENPHLRTPHELLEAYRERHPKDHLSFGRFQQAISVAADPLALPASITYPDGSERPAL